MDMSAGENKTEKKNPALLVLNRNAGFYCWWFAEDETLQDVIKVLLENDLHSLFCPCFSLKRFRYHFSEARRKLILEVLQENKDTESHLEPEGSVRHLCLPQ